MSAGYQVKQISKSRHWTHFLIFELGKVRESGRKIDTGVTPLFLGYPLSVLNKNSTLSRSTLTEGCVCTDSCRSIEFEFISTIMGQDSSVPIKLISRLVLKANSSSQIGALSLQINSRNTQTSLCCRDRTIFESLFRYFRSKLSRSTDRHDPGPTLTSRRSSFSSLLNEFAIHSLVGSNNFSASFAWIRENSLGKLI